MIGDRIKAARQAAGYSAEQVAEFLHVSPATVYRYENGDIAKLPAKHIRPLAEFLHVSPTFLMCFEDQDAFSEPDNDFNKLAPSEIRLVDAYRSLSGRGQQLLMDRAEELKVLYGKKSEDASSQSV